MKISMELRTIGQERIHLLTDQPQMQAGPYDQILTSMAVKLSKAMTTRNFI